MKTTSELYLAPFQGITGAEFREVYAHHFPFIDKFFTPFFVNFHTLKKNFAKKGKEIEKTHHNSHPVIPQILSKDAEEIISFGNYCAELGFDEINWNLGCPFPRVALKKRGSGMLPYPDLVDSILSKTNTKLRVKLSIKCRLGYHSPEEIFNLLDIFREHDISELIIHARIGKQIYRGNVDLGSFEGVVQKTDLPVVYNGDIFGVEDYKMLSERFPSINKWMIGRGLLTDPFLPGDIKGDHSVLAEHRGQVIRKFVDDLYYSYRKSKNDHLHSISVMKELWGYLSNSFHNPVRVFSLVKKAKSFDEYENAVNRIFSEYEWIGSQSLKNHSNLD
jgi:tRNA-dihydrouridine synthase